MGPLVLSVLQDRRDRAANIAGLAVTDDLIVGAGGLGEAATVVASSNARQLDVRTAPPLGLRDVLGTGDALWVCGEHGYVGVSRDRAASWQAIATSTDACLYGIARASDGAVWVVGDGGFAARIHGEVCERVPLGTDARLNAVYAVKDRIAVLGADGIVRVWRGGEISSVATGAPKALTAMAVTKSTWIVVGDGGFVGRSPDGAWFSRGRSGVEIDLEAACALADGRVLAVGARGVVLVSSDDGRTFATLEAPGASQLTSHLWAVEAFGRGAVLGGDGGLIARLAPADDDTWSDRIDVFGDALPMDAMFLAGPDGFLAGDSAADPKFRDVFGLDMPRELAVWLDRRGRGLELGRVDPFDAALETRASLVAAFCGTVDLGGDRQLEIYEWNGPRQVLAYDRAQGGFDGVAADSLDTFAYAADLAQAFASHQISSDAHRVGERKLKGRLAPELQSKRRETEFFYQRAQWIIALLANDGSEVRFCPDVNQPVPPDQLAVRLDACARFIPTALYSLWRSFLFDEAELERYLEVAVAHASKLVRDAGRVIQELRAGRNTLGTITDVKRWLADVRARGLDAVDKRVEVAAEKLEDVARPAWTDFAWKSLDDGAAHRALLERLATEPAMAAQLARLDELRDIEEPDRSVVIEQLAGDLAPELEAVLAGALVRGDALAGVIAKPDESDDEDDDDDDDGAPGWDAIDRALEPVYKGAEPTAHYGTALPYMLGGNDPIHGISVYARTEPVPHFHFVTYGFTDLFQKETDDPDDSGFGFELTFRLAREVDDEAPPSWALNFLQNMGRYVFGTGNRFASGHKMGLNGPIALDKDTKITAICFADDPELPHDIVSAHGKAKFVQIVGITDDEYKLIQEWSTTRLVDMLKSKSDLLITDLDRDSLLDDPVTSIEVKRLVAAEGSSEDLAFAGDMQVATNGEGKVRVKLGALYAAALPRAMRGRLRHGRPYELRGKEVSLTMEPGELSRLVDDNEGVKIELAPMAVLEIEERLGAVLAGTYELDAWPSMEIEVTPSFIRDQQNRAIDVKGVADAERAKEMIAQENARLDAEESGDDEEETGDEDEDDEDDEDDDDWEADDDDEEPPPDPDRVKAALAMTERALQLAPDDDNTQFTHAILLLDAERAGMDGKAEALLSLLPTFEAGTRVNVAVRMGKRNHARFGEAVDLALGEALPERIFGSSEGGNVSSFGNVADELFEELAVAILEHAPDRMGRLTAQLPPSIELLSTIGHRAGKDSYKTAGPVYDRLFSLAIPDAEEDEDGRGAYLRALNNACIQAHASGDVKAATAIADRAQPVARENPYIFHSAACAYAAAGDFKRAFEQVKLAVETGYEHLAKLEVDQDLGELLEWPELQELFRDWRARTEGN